MLATWLGWTDAMVCEAVDGDSIRCDGELIRIRGMDAPETSLTQTCQYRLGMGNAEEELARGEMAREALQGLLERAGAGVRLEDIDYDADRYGRPIAVVWVGDALVSEWMIAQGHAVAYSGGRRDAWCD
jgi:micrococcal nuclease